MDQNLLETCNLEKVKENERATNKLVPSEEFLLLPCQRKFRLQPGDEISLSSIISGLISKVVPSSEEMKNLHWDISAKQMLNEKQSMLFEENLYISSIKNRNCLLKEEHKIFLESDLELVGNYYLNIEESYDGYVVFSNSQMKKGVKNDVCGHDLIGKYENNFVLIAEKRMEFDHVDHARVEKILDARIKLQNLHAKRETKINAYAQKFKAIVNMKGRDDTFLMDGGILLLTRYLIINNFRGEFKYFTMNVSGRILQCVLCVKTERKNIKVFNRHFPNAITVVNMQYFNNVVQDSSETYYAPSGRIILHFWHGFNYILHSARAPLKPPEKIIPKLELMWKSDNLLYNLYKQDKTVSYEIAYNYLSHRPNISDFLLDWLTSILRYKPDNVLEFTIKYCQNLKRGY